MHHGNNRDPLPSTFRPHTLVLTTYGVVRREEDTFASRPWGGVVVDEAQAIKNAGSAQAKAIRKLRGGSLWPSPARPSRTASPSCGPS